MPNIVGKEIVQEERELFSHPLRMGGLNIALPQDLHKNLEESIELSAPFANMDDVCHDVQIEPKIQSLDGEIFSSNTTTTDEDARLEIKANGLWGSRFNCTFFDVKIFNPHAKSCPKTIKDAYKYHESIKRNKYEEPRNRTQQLQCTGFCLLGWCRSISIARYETTRNQDQRKTRRAVSRHYKLHPNENQLRTSEELCSLLEGMCPQASCSQ